MTTGPPLYLVSACGSAEEFVAAFRRYADRTGLFVPSAAPLPAGRRGRLALTLKDGGVMIEGEAEILQSSVKPTVLHGRPGMTVKFVEPDEPSKTVIGELEKARLAMKPAPPSVPPRPAEIPAMPRPVPPAPAGRIDAANALAECVVIGDPATLVMTANAPRSAMASEGKFMVPAIPAVGAPRPNSPSTPPAIAAKPPVVPERPKPPTTPPDPAATPLPAPSKLGSNIAQKLTSVGFPSVDKAPAKTDSGRVAASPTAGVNPAASHFGATTLGMQAVDSKPADAGLLQTKLGTDAPPNPTSPGMPAQNPLLETQLGHSAPRADASKFVPATTVPGMGPDTDPDPPRGSPSQQVTVAAKPLIDPIGEDEATAIGAAPTKKTTDPMPAAAPRPTNATPAAEPAEAATQRADNPRADAAKQKATSLGFPVVGRNVFETQPLGLVPPAPSSMKFDVSTPDPAPPTLPKSARQSPPPARGKNPTTPPLTPRHPTPVAPVPIVRSPAKNAPAINEEEKTDIGTAPTASATPVDAASASDSGAAKVPARSGGMRASEILAAIPAGDWTMSPDESVPHALAPEEKVGAVVAPQEPTPAPASPPKGPPTGDWTIQLDPETGWGEPEKLAKAAATPAAGTGESATSGNPIVAVASDKAIQVQQWDEKPTGIGEAKIEIDSTLMEPLKSMPGTDDDAAQIVDRPMSDVPPPLTPMPPRPTSGYGLAEQAGFMPPMMAPQRGSTTDIIGYPRAPIGAQDPAQRQKMMLLLAIAAGFVMLGAIVLLVVSVGGDKKPAPAPTGGGSAKLVKPATTADAAVVAPAPPKPAPTPPTPTPPTPTPPSGTQQAAVQPEGSAAETPPTPPKPPAAGGPCKVDIKSDPSGADVYLDKNKLGTTPTTFELPCGTEAKLLLRRKPLPSTTRAFTPIAGKGNKLTVKLTRTMFSVKVTSTPMGATITSKGKSLGVTPTTIKLPSFDTTAIVLTKPGFAPETSRVNPKSNNASHHVVLKKVKGR